MTYEELLEIELDAIEAQAAIDEIVAQIVIGERKDQ